MSSSREAILSSIRSAHTPVPPLPPYPEGVRYTDVRAQFTESLKAVGGQCVAVPDRDAINAELARMPEYLSAVRIASLVAGVGRANADLLAGEDPHAFEGLDFCVLPGVLGVAENGAVWVTERGSRNRAAWFLTQHLAIVLPAHALVHNLHDAYAQLQIGGAGFAMFISGPSKTADIEQALVIGAQGPRSCTVFLVG